MLCPQCLQAPVSAQAVGVPNAVSTVAKIANQMIIQSGCHALQPLIHDLYPSLYSSPASLELSSSELDAIAAMNPRLVECAQKGT